MFLPPSTKRPGWSRSESKSSNSPAMPQNVNPYLQADWIIFDFGLFHRLWGIQECIANYLDGGYMRSLWCVGYVLACICLYIVTRLKNPFPWSMLPIISMQSFYCIGMLILMLSSLPKLLRLILEAADGSGRLFLTAVVAYAGIFLNFFLARVAWHTYWNMQKNYKKTKVDAKRSSVDEELNVFALGLSSDDSRH